MGSSIYRSLIIAGLLVIHPTQVIAQRLDIRGNVTAVVGADSAPVGSVWAVLHKVTLIGGAPIDSVLTGPDGIYTFHTNGVDTTAMYVVSIMHRGIAYFTNPISTRGDLLGEAERLFVYDTSSTAAHIYLGQRHVVVRPPEEDGSLQVLELLVLRNDSTLTRVAPDSTHPTWVGAVPRGVVQLQVGEGDIAAGAVFRRGDSLVVLAPIPPGERQVVITYTIPRGMRTLHLPVDQFTGHMNVLIADSAYGRETGGALELIGSESLEDVSFTRYEGRQLQAGMPVRLEFTRRSFTDRDLINWIAILSGLLMLAAFAYWLTVRKNVVRGVDPQAIAAAVAALDRDFAAIDQPTRDQRLEYSNRREHLKRVLNDALARRSDAD